MEGELIEICAGVGWGWCGRVSLDEPLGDREVVDSWKDPNPNTNDDGEMVGKRPGKARCPRERLVIKPVSEGVEGGDRFK